MQQASPLPDGASSTGTTEQMVADSGTYDLLKKRLSAQGDALLAQAGKLNDERLAEFGHSEQALILRTRARTENNCVARDIVRIGDLFLFGYNVFIGLRKETAVGDVFGLYRLSDNAGADELEAVPHAGTFLDDSRFLSDFRELYAYYKQATLTQLRVTQDKLLAAFQIGQQVTDVRVFRWAIERDGTVRYTDNRGERDIALPPSHDFEWTLTTREDHVGGKHPHVNILDTVFVETVGGDLTIKVENNSATGQGIYSEPVDDKNQSLADAEVAYAKLGLLILLRVRPYRETKTRYLVFNTRTQQVERIDAIGTSCVQLPEDHGIIFPGGCYLQSGEFTKFDLPGEVLEQLRFKRMVRSPNGEDVLYIFYQPTSGHYGLFTYNLINKTLSAPIVANGYARLPDGRILVFQEDRGEPTRVHPMQLWQTPFVHDEYASQQPTGTGFFGRIGNADLVRGISDLMGIARGVREQAPTRAAYDDLIRQCARVSDAYFWLDAPEAGGLSATLKGIAEASRHTLAEFEKVDAIRRETARALSDADTAQRALATDIASMLWRKPDDFMQALARLREQRGRLQMLKELRYADLPRIAAMDTELVAEQQRVGERALAFLADEKAFDGHRETLARLSAELPQANTTSLLTQTLDTLDGLAAGVDVLTEQLGNLPGGDAVTRAAILDRISLLYTDINRLRADARNRRKSLGATEATAEFGAQFKLFGQAVDNALEFADTPEKCDDTLTRLLAQLEELEGRFAEQECFLVDIAAKREAVVEALSARRQTLVDAQQRRSQALVDAAGRILDGVPRRVGQLAGLPEVHSYFAADPLLAKLRKLIDDLRTMGAAVAADDLDTRLKTARDSALRSVRDKTDLVADDGNALRLGRHSFTINRQPLDLTLIFQDGQLAYHLAGTDYHAPVHEPRLAPLARYWSQPLVSESATLTRAEYLAGQFLQSVQRGQGPVTWTELLQLAIATTEATTAIDGARGGESHATLLQLLRQFAAPRYQESYQKGVHDEDAARVLAALVVMQDEARLLAWGPTERALALLYWHNGRFVAERESLQRRARAAMQMQLLFGTHAALSQLEADLVTALTAFAREFMPDLLASEGPSDPPELAAQRLATVVQQAATYLVHQLASERGAEGWALSGAGEDLATALTRELDRGGRLGAWQQDLDAANAPERWRLARDWVRAFAQAQAPQSLAWVDDAASALAMPGHRERINATLDTPLTGLLSEHVRIEGGAIALNLNDFWRRYLHHLAHDVTGFEALQSLRHDLIAREKARLRLNQFQAKPLSTFVRNRLIDEVYLPLVGDNLAKQLGATGEGNRTDRMGLLLLISPPGYGKTTLMEYVADRLGLIFVRINCPALGHDVTSIDPATAPNSTARQELEKLNLGLAMGNNVMLYLDDIQHTNPEFLQKFIALADGTRRIEGVWNGEPRSYDLRGKRFSIVMAGNPYTESGDVFKIPDMLANRADIYNLGDVLSGREALFSLSYIENALTANPALMPLASRDPQDVHRLVRMAQGEDVATSTFSHGYSAAEMEELTALMQRLFKARDLLLKVNLAYIESAAQQDAYRQEPPFKLQGSYRNMTKLAGKITALMRDDELDALLRDHYRGEAQTLTTGAEENLLKLAQLLGRPTADEDQRYRHIRDEFVRRKKLGGDDTDGSTRIANTLLDISRAVDSLKPGAPSDDGKKLAEALHDISRAVDALKPDKPNDEGRRMADALLELSVTYRKIMLPLITATEHRLKLDSSIRDEVERVGKALEDVKRKPKE